jgi:hypothetical protein
MEPQFEELVQRVADVVEKRRSSRSTCGCTTLKRSGTPRSPITILYSVTTPGEFGDSKTDNPNTTAQIDKAEGSKS